MKRTQRNLFFILSLLAILWLVLLRLPPLLALWLVIALVVFGMGLVTYARDLLLGRYRARRREWRKSIESYSTFERKLADSRLAFVLIPIYLTIYSFDGIAISRNGIGRCLMELNELDEAERWLRSSLQRDPLYAIPYTNLGTIAGWRGDAKTAQLEFRRAVELGFSPAAAQTLMRRALDRKSPRQ